MSNSSGKYRVSLKFSSKDPEQEEVVALLKQMGRRKSAFITKAIKFYLAENPEADIPGVTSATISKSSIKSILKELLEEMDLPLQNKGQNNEQNQKESLESPSLKEDNSQKDTSSIEELSPQLTDEDLDNFIDGLSAWS